jgi:ABC-type branched-subunit amino acid transport system substrate-binding protein
MYDGPCAYYAQKLGASVIQHAGTLYTNVAAAQLQADGEHHAAEAAGWKYVYQRGFAPTESNFTADIVRMRSAGVQVFMSGGLTVSNLIQFLQEADQQNWHPIIIDNQAYTTSFLQLAGSQANGLLGYQQMPLFLSPQEAQTIPEVGLFQQWLQKTSPNDPLDLFSVYGWTEAELMVQALKAAGPKVTRAGVLRALGNTHSFGANGLLAPVDVGAKKEPTCYILWQVTNGAFQRVDTPTTGYRCDGTVPAP